jgi:valyl-tRNA synthetase
VVDKAFGTGVVKITPAHDPVDFEVGQRHRLPIVNIFNDDATLNANGKPFEGLDRTVAREAVVEALRREGRRVKVEEYTHAVGYSERADVPVEPRLSRQWFLRYPKVSEARRAVVDGAITFWPKRWEKIYLYWLDHLKDWCVSRQLWWGHRLPVWYRKGHEEEIHVSLEGPPDPENWEQDPDVVDTWFSSWLWPFATFGWPDPEKMAQNRFDTYFPTQVLVTGPDILFFWVARMIMASAEFLEDRKDRRPFRHVYLTGIVRDAGGRKMSKSLGNSPDPIELMDRYGTDGVRLGLLSIAPQGQDICFDEKSLEQGRNFCTKLWNACRFRRMQGGETNLPKEILAALPMRERTPYDESILYALKMAVDGFSSHLERFELNGALKCLMSFFRNDFCDGYLEFLKYSRSEASPGIQDLCLHYVLKRLYPMAPFITEELWERMQLGPAPLSASRLEEEDWDRYVKNEVEGMRPVWEEVECLKTVVSEVRFLKAEWGLAAQKTVCMKVFLREEGKKFFQRYGDMLRRLAGLESLESIASTDGVDGHPVKVTSVGSFYLGLGKSLDVAEEIRRLEGEKQLYEKYIVSADKRLTDEAFCSRAPAEVREATRRQRDENEVKWKEISRRLERLKKVSESPLGE